MVEGVTEVEQSVRARPTTEQSLPEPGFATLDTSFPGLCASARTARE